MLLKIKKIPKFYKYLISIFITLFFISLLFVLLISFFPIKSTTSNMSAVRFSRFVSPWPTSALDQESQERKRLKRYARTEQKKRLEKQLQRMNILSVPIYDLSLDDEAELLVNDSKYYPDKTSVLWPVLPLNKQFNNTLNQSVSRRAVNIVLPNKNWTSLFEGVYVAAGDEIKTNIPIIKDRRYLNFYVFPLTPGNIRVILGQYVWAKTFAEEEVQKIQKINIPINDPTATSIRVLSISCSCYLLDMSINQIQRNGREPIKVAIGSSLWLPNKNYLIHRFQEDTTPVEDDSSDDSDTTTTQDNTEEAKNVDENTDSTKAEEPTKPLLPTTDTTTTKQSVLDANDPLLQVSNPQLLVDNEYSTAFGYNVVIIQAPPIDTSLLKNQKLLKNVAPNVSNLLENSVYFENNIETLKGVNEIFRQTIFQNYLNLYDDNSSIFQYKIEHNEKENTYQKFRRYGYKVVSITPPETLFFSPNLTNDISFSTLYNRWLDSKDWQFENRNMRIDEKLGATSGLDAIFNLDNSKKLQPPLTARDYSSLSRYLTDVSNNVNKVPNWHPNEYRLISNKNYYDAKVVYAFQNWTEGNTQTRFLAHILLNSNNNADKPNLSNLKKSFLSLGPFSLTKPKYLKSVAAFAHLDMAIGDILNTIKARRIENRTIIFLLFPNNDNNKSATGIYKIPGLIGKKISSNINMKDVLSTIFSNVGIPTGTNIKSMPSNIDGNMLEIRNYIHGNNSQEKSPHFLKYTLLIKPNLNLCSPILWKSSQSNLFGIQANYPISRIIDPTTLEIYPCSISNKFVEFTWYQSNSPSLIMDSEDGTPDLIGGHFFFFKNKKDFPKVFFGKNLLSYDNLIFMFKSLTPENSQNIFYVEEKDLENTIAKTKESFFGYDDISTEKNSKIALFVTPL